ncbi:MAG TPA: protein-L-isoaspartate(D-aspartate) O-methyltransferase [Planctomycetaceae bacterium]|nr:protein-L-isoaspartate(D-aspartate) O-methyltransferase [Planctomycetaceae bacterium]HIQ22971.1 protein-L-isoaspartate(D-aspartate) O-methyltransferase [Planctomycetota bacterium]
MRTGRKGILIVVCLGAGWLAAGVPAVLAAGAPYELARHRMVDEEIVAAGVTNPRVIQAMRSTPRHEFVSRSQRRYAYYDMALPIGYGQTISPPFVVAYMTEQLDPQPTDRVLEIGTGSGYQAAVLSPLVREVYTIEIVEPLGRRAAATLRRLRYENVHVKIGDGYQGWPEHAPFDKIIVTCSPEGVPPALVEQLKEGGRMVIPVGERYQQNLYLLRKTAGRLETEALRPTLFVPMTGRAEQLRQVQPDPANPGIRNGDFEEVMGDPPRPRGWHYQRQLTLVTADDAPSGKHYVTFANRDPGRGCRALQGMPVDGRKVKKLEVTLHVRGRDIQPGQTLRQMPMLVITFYDQRRAEAGHGVMGPWRGTFEWRRQSVTMDVPLRAREAIVRIGLLGAIGEISFDNIEIRRAEGRP